MLDVRRHATGSPRCCARFRNSRSTDVSSSLSSSSSASGELPLRFTEAIDMCAMRTGAGDTDAYLAEWRKADPLPVGDDLEAEADKALAELDAKFTRERLVALVKAGGKEDG